MQQQLDHIIINLASHNIKYDYLCINSTLVGIRGMGSVNEFGLPKVVDR